MTLNFPGNSRKNLNSIFNLNFFYKETVKKWTFISEKFINPIPRTFLFFFSSLLMPYCPKNWIETNLLPSFNFSSFHREEISSNEASFPRFKSRENIPSPFPIKSRMGRRNRKDSFYAITIQKN